MKTAVEEQEVPERQRQHPHEGRSLRFQSAKRSLVPMTSSRSLVTRAGDGRVAQERACKASATIGPPCFSMAQLATTRPGMPASRGPVESFIEARLGVALSRAGH